MDMCYPSQSFKTGWAVPLFICLILYSTIIRGKFFLTCRIPSTKWEQGIKRENIRVYFLLKKCMLPEGSTNSLILLDTYSPSVWKLQFLKTSVSSEGAKQLAISSLEHLATHINLFVHLFHFSTFIYKPGSFLHKGKTTNKRNIGLDVGSFPLSVIWLCKPLFLASVRHFWRAQHFCKALSSFSTCC